ncbi:hypothetical protein [Streptomyces sp. AK010]|uniref:hypothetical protein n=1 Tax=Streptomyces sp. AK010 TaxID=2723074 RepID=UPI00178D151C|nr:formamidopyrimidine-DNA glycosylase [Streptomyces sp. AK010]
MTGRLVCGHAEDPVEAHDRVLFTLGGGRQLRFRDQRKLQGLWLAHDESDVEGLLRRQGPDALEVDRAQFEEVLSSRRGHLKTALTDQSVLAGLGNLLADEIRWRARLRPDRRGARPEPGGPPPAVRRHAPHLALVRQRRLRATA